MRARWHDRKERRAWRRERRKGSPSPYDAHNQAEASNYDASGGIVIVVGVLALLGVF